MWLTLLLPPVLGAAIGYITNSLAIKMLFRPLTVKKIGPVRIPFTPGIIPRQRESLARNIGRMVSEKLLTAEVAGEHIRSPKLRASVKGKVSQFTEEVWHTPIVDLLPGKTSQENLVLGDLVMKVLRSKELEGLVKNGLDWILQHWGHRTIGAWLHLFSGPLKAEELVSRLKTSSLVATLRKEIIANLIEAAEEGKTLSQIISQSTVERLIAFIGWLYDPIGRLLLYYLGREDTKKDLAVRGRFFIQDVIEKLNIFQKFFVSAGQYDRTLKEKMPEILEDFLAQVDSTIKDGEQKEILLVSLQSYYDKHRDDTLSDLLSKEPKELEWDFLEGIQNLFDSIFHFLEKPASQEVLGGILEKWKEKNLVEAASDLIRKEPGTFEGWLKEKAMQYFHSLFQEKNGGVSKAVSNFFETNSHRSIGYFFSISGEGKEKMDEFLSDWSLKLLEDKIGTLLESLDLQALVEKRINSLDMEQVEELLLLVIKKHLKYINIFGAFLGALIGGAQIFLRFLPV